MIVISHDVIICLYVMNMVDRDKFHTNYATIHLLELNENRGGNIETGDGTPRSLAPVLRNDMPALKYVVRMTGESRSLVQYVEKSLYQNNVCAEPDLFQMMPFPAVEGDPVAALGVNSILNIYKSTVPYWTGSFRAGQPFNSAKI